MFALIVSENAYLYLSVVSEILMIVHFARQESVCPSLQSLVQKEISCSTTNGDTLDGTRQQLIVHQALNAENLLHSLQESQRVFSIRQITYNARTSLNSMHPSTIADGNLSGLQQDHIHQAKSLGHSVVDAIHSSIQIRVSRIDGNVILYSQTNTSLHLVGISQVLQAMKDKWMMRHNQIASQLQRLANHLLGHIQAQ